jgi:molybdopterin-guanine dinucleotide biosynthesis protein A
VIPDGTALVLAGGRSRRFGADKRLALWGGKPLVEAAVANAAELFPSVLVAVRRPEDLSFLGRPGVRIVADAFDAHALGGLLTGLSEMKTGHLLAVGGDMPLVQPAVVRLLWSLRGEADAVVPRWQGRLQPLCAVYAWACLPAGRALAAEGVFAPRALVTQVRTRVVEEDALRAADPAGLSFLDADTPEALEELRRMSTENRIHA